MNNSIGTSRSLTMGLVVSVACHVGTAVVLVRYGGERGITQRPNKLEASSVLVPLPDSEPADPEDPAIKRLHLGIEKSAVVTETWLGFAEPTEHSGPLATIEQAALSLTPTGQPAPDEPQPDAPASAVVEPTPEARPAVAANAGPEEATPPSVAEPSSESVKAPEAAAALPALSPSEPEATHPVPSAAAADDEAPSTPETLNLPATDEITPRIEEPLERMVPDAGGGQIVPTVPQADAVSRADQTNRNPATNAAPRPLPKPRRVSGDRPGVLSDRESVSAALKEAIDVKFDGKPAAAEGLEIKTTNPRWSITTQLTSSPKNPVVWMAFGRDGRVIDADFLNGENTGWTSVDEPLLHAVFAWRAKGVALDELPASDPKAAVRVVLRITLRGA